MDPRFQPFFALVRARSLGALLLGTCALASCSGEDEVRAAEPAPGRAHEVVEQASRDELVQPGAIAQRESSASASPAQPQAPVRPDSLAAVIAALDDGREPQVLVSPEQVELLFSKPDDDAVDGPYATHLYLDLIGDPQAELVVVISGGWWGMYLHLCVFTPAEDGGWQLALRGRSGPCRAFPSLRVAGAGEQRYLVASIHDSWGTGTGSSSWNVFAPVGKRLEAVLTVPSGGWHSEYHPVDSEHRTKSFELSVGVLGTTAELVLQADGTSGVILEGYQDVTIEIRTRYQRPRDGGKFAPLDPAAPALDEDRIMALLGVEWLSRNRDLAFERARTGSPQEMQWLRKLAESQATHGHTDAQALLAQLPSKEALEAQIKAFHEAQAQKEEPQKP